METVVVCDYENQREGYAFPNGDMGSAENRIWHFAMSATSIPNLRVILAGPKWDPSTIPGAIHFPKRLLGEGVNEFLNLFGRADFLFSGHEYFDKNEWMTDFEKCAERLLTYQLHPYEYRGVCFDGRKRILFVYSDEMVKHHWRQNPIKALLFHSGPQETPYYTPVRKRRAIWMGRLDWDKQPHIAIKAAAQVGIDIFILGRTVRHPGYGQYIRPLLEQPHVYSKGVVSGAEKMALIAESMVAIYTIAPNFMEAGAGVLGEFLRCGVPVAAYSYRGNDVVCEAVDNKSLGVVKRATFDMSEVEIVNLLSTAIEEAMSIDTIKTYQAAEMKYDDVRLVSQILAHARGVVDHITGTNPARQVND